MAIPLSTYTYGRQCSCPFNIQMQRQVQGRMQQQGPLQQHAQGQKQAQVHTQGHRHPLADITSPNSSNTYPAVNGSQMPVGVLPPPRKRGRKPDPTSRRSQPKKRALKRQLYENFKDSIARRRALEDRTGPASYDEFWSLLGSRTGKDAASAQVLSSGILSSDLSPAPASSGSSGFISSGMLPSGVLSSVLRQDSCERLNSTGQLATTAGHDSAGRYDSAGYDSAVQYESARNYDSADSSGQYDSARQYDSAPQLESSELQDTPRVPLLTANDCRGETLVDEGSGSGSGRTSRSTSRSPSTGSQSPRSATPGDVLQKHLAPPDAEAVPLSRSSVRRLGARLSRRLDANISEAFIDPDATSVTPADEDTLTPVVVNKRQLSRAAPSFTVPSFEDDFGLARALKPSTSFKMHRRSARQSLGRRGTLSRFDSITSLASLDDELN